MTRVHQRNLKTQRQTIFKEFYSKVPKYNEMLTNGNATENK